MRAFVVDQRELLRVVEDARIEADRHLEDLITFGVQASLSAQLDRYFHECEWAFMFAEEGVVSGALNEWAQWKIAVLYGLEVGFDPVFTQTQLLVNRAAVLGELPRAVDRDRAVIEGAIIHYGAWEPCTAGHKHTQNWLAGCYKPREAEERLEALSEILDKANIGVADIVSSAA